MGMNPLFKRVAPFFSRAQVLPKRNFSSEIFINRLSFYTTEEELEKVFSRFGNIKQVRLIKDKQTKRLRGFAFIDYSSEEEAQKAVKAMDGRIHGGRMIFVEIAEVRSTEGLT